MLLLLSFAEKMAKKEIKASKKLKKLLCNIHLMHKMVLN